MTRATRAWLQAVQKAAQPRPGMKLATLAVKRYLATQALQAENRAIKRRR